MGVGVESGGAPPKLAFRGPGRCAFVTPTGPGSLPPELSCGRLDGRCAAARRTPSLPTFGSLGGQNLHTAITTGCAVMGRYSSGVVLTPTRTSSPSRKGRVTISSTCHRMNASRRRFVSPVWYVV